MPSNFNLNRLVVSISVAAITVVGTFSPLTSPVNAQQARCARRNDPLRPLSQVPANVLTFARQRAGGVTLTGVADIEREGNRTVYEIRGFQPNNCSVEVDVVLVGGRPQLDEVETQLPSVNQLPSPVRATLNSRAPGFRATLIEQSRRPAGVVVYELEGILRGQETEVDINSNGTLISIEAAS